MKNTVGSTFKSNDIVINIYTGAEVKVMGSNKESNLFSGIVVSIPPDCEFTDTGEVGEYKPKLYAHDFRLEFT